MCGELWRERALGMAARIRSGDVSSREVIESHLARIESINPHLNANVWVLADDARTGADAADRARAKGEPMGPLHGVPFTVKENIDLAGTATTNGVKMLVDAVATIDAPVVERMRAAGAIPIGRTNLPDFGLLVHTDSDLHGLTRNPWNPNVTTGGSSGGEAASISSGMSPMGLGNDLGGSLRNPAHCCGISSIKPTTGVVPSATCIPPLDKSISFQIMAVEGVLGRHIADVRAGFNAVVGVHTRDPLSIPAQLSEMPTGRALRIAVLAEPSGGSTDAGIAAATRRAADALADMGHAITETSPASYARAVELWALILSGDLRALRPLLDAVMGEGGRAFLDLTDAAMPEIDVNTWRTVHTERFAVAREWTEFFADFDALITPVWAHPAFAHGVDIADAAGAAGAAATLETMRPVLPPNLLGLPVAVTPAGPSEGMPVGVQVIGDRFHDLACLSIAELIEQSPGVLTPIDPVLS